MVQALDDLCQQSHEESAKSTRTNTTPPTTVKCRRMLLQHTLQGMGVQPHSPFKTKQKVLGDGQEEALHIMSSGTPVMAAHKVVRPLVEWPSTL